QGGSSEILTLNPGVYYIDTLSIGGQASICLNGPVQLYVQGDISLGGGGISNNGSNGTPTDLQIYCTGANVDISGGAVFCGLLYAPNASVHITGTAADPQDIFGAITANNIQCSGQVQIHRYTPASDYSFGTYTECQQTIDDDASTAYVHIEGADVWIRKGMPTTRFDLGSGTYLGGIGNRNKPTLIDIDRDKDLDLFIGGENGSLKYYKNTGSPANSIFTSQGNLQADGGDIDIGDHSAPYFCDIDYDGDFDLFVGRLDGRVSYYENIGSSTYATFTSQGSLQAGGVDIDATDYSSPCFGDIDSDGDFDLVVGDYSNGLRLYRNNGNRVTPNFANEGSLRDSLGAVINIGTIHSPQLFDIDYDADLDLFIGNYHGTIFLYENVGTPQNYSFAYQTSYWMGIDVGHAAAPCFGDLDGDGKIDLLVGEFYNNIEYYQNIGEELYKNAPMQYNLVYGNAGNAPAENIQITDYLPANFVYVSSNPSGSLVGNILTWSLGTLQPNYIGTITIYGTINPTTQNSTLTNIATITTTTPECDYLPNIATHTLYIGTPTPDLLITKTGPSSWPSNYPLTYQLAYKNTVLVTGLLGEYYKNYDLTGTPIYRRTDLYLDYRNSTWNPWSWANDQSFSVRWTGWIYIASIGSRRFEISSNDTARLSINGGIVANGGGVQTGSYNFTTIGWHRIELIFQEAGGNDQYIRLRWDPTGGTSYSIIPNSILRSIDPEELNRGGEVLANAQVQDLLPPASSMTYTSANPLPSVISGQLLTWNPVNLQPGQEYQITINAMTGN
ncbi:MAG: FG-GAP-like repeat-containing protein, partial [Candidatus Desantisbacteria bacterium]